MDKLPPIPSPPRVLFREFRIAAVPVAAFLVVLGLTILTWRNYVGPSNLVGEVEAIRAIVTSTQPGHISTLGVGLLEHVTVGQPLAVIVPADPRALAAELGLSRARIGFLKDNVDARLRQQNNQIAFLGLRLNWMNQRAELATLRAQESYYRLEFERQERLSAGGDPTNRIASADAGRPGFRESAGPGLVNNGAPMLDQGANATSKDYESQRLSSNLRVSPSMGGNQYSLWAGSAPRLNSEAEFEVAKRDHDSLTAQIEERTRLVAELEAAMNRIRPEEARLDEDIPIAIRNAVSLEERELGLLESKLGPVTLTAPMNGVVAVISHRAGENVLAGEPILTLSAEHSDRIVAFVRQPLNLDVHTNMTMEIRSRSQHREAGVGRIIAVGTQLEAILPELIPARVGGAAGLTEYGLPILVGVPPGLKVLPGEMVDLNPVGD